MVKPELGNKRVCVSCGAKFYDLGRTPAICPKCDTEQPAEQPRLRRIAPVAPPEASRGKSQPQPGLEEGDVEVEVEVEEEEEGVLEDTSDLEGEDAMADVEVEQEGGEEER
ncbi:MAG: TIGR02300 family protein [Rhodospirillales bacterium]|nr:TIGR02300 family protein [Rhodospirillales bacterium]